MMRRIRVRRLTKLNNAQFFNRHHGGIVYGTIGTLIDFKFGNMPIDTYDRMEAYSASTGIGGYSVWEEVDAW